MFMQAVFKVIPCEFEVLHARDSVYMKVYMQFRDRFTCLFIVFKLIKLYLP